MTSSSNLVRAYGRYFNLTEDDMGWMEAGDMESLLSDLRRVAASEEEGAEALRHWGGWGQWQPTETPEEAARGLRREMGIDDDE